MNMRKHLGRWWPRTISPFGPTLALFAALVSLTTPSVGQTLEHFLVKREGRLLRLSGRVRMEAADGSLLLEERDGRYWVLTAEEITDRQDSGEPFRPFTPDELARQLRDSLGQGFAVRKTAHYVIIYNCGESYAAWCGWLFERLFTGFQNFWWRRGLLLDPPEFPLVAIVFKDKADFIRFARQDVGEAAGAIIGYYHLERNQMILYDLTESSAISSQARRRSLAEINRMLAHPEAARAVSTVVHEATHQLCFNCGLFSRLAEVPLWLSEGIAMFFETPDLQSSTGWAGIGEMNSKRAADFQAFLPRRRANSLLSLIESDDRFRDPSAALDAYAEAWALCYFLLRRHPQKMTNYLKLMKARPLLEEYPAEARVSDFEKIFGPLHSVEADLLRFFSR